MIKAIVVASLYFPLLIVVGLTNRLFKQPHFIQH